MKQIIMLLFIAMISGCATTYERGISHESVSITGFDYNTVYSVEFNGNGYTGRETANSFVLMKAGELATEHNKKYFALIDYTDATTVSTYYETEGKANIRSTQYGNSRYGTIDSKSTTYERHISKPNIEMVIFIFDDPNKLKQGIKYYDASYEYLKGKQLNEHIKTVNMVWWSILIGSVLLCVTAS